MTERPTVTENAPRSAESATWAEAALPSDMRQLQRALYSECVTAKWDPNLLNSFAEECAHLHEEVTEAFKAWRVYRDMDVHFDEDGKPQGVPIELADVLIGLFYNAELHGFDLLGAVLVKHRFNMTRNYVDEGRQLHSVPTATTADATEARHSDGYPAG